MCDPKRFAWLSATGNRFAVLDGLIAPVASDPADLVRSLVRREGRGMDGLLLLLPARGEASLCMEVYNLDGSRAEACGNGLRCIARLARELGYIQDTASIETDAGVREVQLLPCQRGVWRARVEMGAPRRIELDVELQTSTGRVRADLVDLGNPHCVMFVDELAEHALEAWGPELERHPRFPQRTNVELVERRETGLRLRVWERGVGETASCGSGATAAAMAAVLRSMCSSPVEVLTRGGRLCVEWDGSGSAWLSGSVEHFEPGASAGSERPSFESGAGLEARC
jgi:diaminopimelate epimerase